MYSAERHFVKTAYDQMETLDSDGLKTGMGAHLNAIDVLPALGAIKEAALCVEARAVTRAIDICQDIVACTENTDVPELEFNLIGLKSLIGLYADGLFEIDPDFKLVIEGPAPFVPIETVEAVSEITAPEAHTENTDLETVYLEGRHAASVSTLRPLLKLVQDNDNLQALESLMSRSVIDTQSLVEAEPTPIMVMPHTVKFEALMRLVTNLILSEARHNQKTISVSYAADFEEIGADIAGHIQNFLEILCLSIVANGISKTTTQISLTGQERERQYRFSVNWTGKDISKQAKTHHFFKQSIAGLRAIGGDIQFRDMALKTELALQTKSDEYLQNLEVSFPLALREQAKPKKLKGATASVSLELTSDNLAQESLAKDNLVQVGGASR